MPKITRISQAEAEQLRAKLNQLLAPLAELGLTFKLGNMRFTPTNARMKLEVIVPAADGTVRDPVVDDDAASFRRLAHIYGMKPTDLGRTFSDRGEQFTIKGLRQRARRFPIIVERQDGRSFKYPWGFVRDKLNPTAARTAPFSHGMDIGAGDVGEIDAEIAGEL